MNILLVNNSSGWHAFLSVISLLLIFVFILVLAYFSTKFVAKYQSNIMSRKSNIRIIESSRISNNKYVAIVMIGKDYYAIALGKDEITFIDKLDKDGLRLEHSSKELGEDSEGGLSDSESESSKDKPSDLSVSKLDFKEVLSKIKNNKSKDNDMKLK